MKSTFLSFVLVCGQLAAPAQTLPPATIQYQGRVSVSGTVHNGTGYFKFLLFAPDKRLWSNADSHGGSEPLAGYEPAGSISVSVSEGLFSADLGSGTMPAITPGVFFDGTGNVRSEIYMRVWFTATGGGTFVKLSPDRRLSSVPFALVAGTVGKSAITSEKIATGAVGTAQLAGGAVGTGQLADSAVTAGKLGAGAVGAAQLSNGVVTTAKLAPAGGGAGELRIGSAYLADGAVTSATISDGAIVSGDIAPETISPDRLSADYAIFGDHKARGQTGGESGANTVQTRTLNTVVAKAGNSIALNINTNVITLQPGTYFVHARCPGVWCLGHQGMFFNKSDNKVAIYGTTEYCVRVPGNTYADQSSSEMRGYVSVSGVEKTFEIRHFTELPYEDGLGRPGSSNAAAPETTVFTTAHIVRVK